MARTTASEHKAFVDFAKAVSGEKITATDWRNLRKAVEFSDLPDQADDASARRAVDEFAAAVFNEYGYCCWRNWREDGQFYDADCCECCPNEPVGTPESWDEARIEFDLAVFDGGVNLKAPVTYGDLAVVDYLTRNGLRACLEAVRAAAKEEKAAKAAK